MMITSIIVQAVKKLTWSKASTNLLAFIVVMAVTMLYFSPCARSGGAIVWYMVAAAIAPGALYYQFKTKRRRS